MANKKTKNSAEEIAKRRKKQGLPEEVAVVEEAKVDAELDLIALASEKKRAKNEVDRVRRKSAFVAGDPAYVSVPFFGRTMIGRTKVTNYRRRTLLIPLFGGKEGEVTISADGKIGNNISYNLKQIQVTYGTKKVVRKKTSQSARARTGKGRKNGSATEIRQVAWFTLSVPADATFVDAMKWVQTFGKVPIGIRMGRKEHYFSAMKFAPALLT
jgi:hypothetical protein